MGLVETVARELLYKVKKRFCGRAFDPFAEATVHELFPLLFHDFQLLLPHRPPEKVSLSEREASQCGGYLHDLFLVENDAVGFP